MPGTYSPKDVKVQCGLFPIEGIAQEGVEVRWLGTGAEAYVGVTGSGAVVEDANRAGEVTVTLMATSLTNALLSAQFLAGNPYVPFGVISLSTGGEHVSGAAKIKRIPDVTYAAGMPVLPWVFVLPEMLAVLAGSVT